VAVANLFLDIFFKCLADPERAGEGQGEIVNDQRYRPADLLGPRASRRELHRIPTVDLPPFGELRLFTGNKGHERDLLLFPVLVDLNLLGPYVPDGVSF